MADRQPFEDLYREYLGRIYAYEVDGRGHAVVMDDDNVPSLLSIPYFGYHPKDDGRYQTTRRFILSDRNPYFYRGHYAEAAAELDGASNRA